MSDTPFTIVFATNNPNKLAEIRKIVGSDINILSLKDINCNEELPETHETIPENAVEKAQYVYDHYGHNCFSEDTGLEVTALNGEPGVHAAHYAGPARDAEANMTKVLEGLEGKSDRSARFRTVIALIIDGTVHQFEGIVNGNITLTKSGDTGFGYDPIFSPEGYEGTFATLGLTIKNEISHRARAMKKLIQWLEEKKIRKG